MFDFLRMRQYEFIELFQADGKSNLVYASGQNIDRIVSVYKACYKTKKALVVDVYVASVLQALRKYAKLPYASKEYAVKVLYTKYTSNRIARLGKKEILYQFKDYKVRKEEISANPSAYVLLVRPSMQTDLARISNIDGGNLVFSLWKGYQDKAQSKKLIDYCCGRGFQLHHIHTGGHAGSDSLKKMAEAIQPKIIVPIHTFHKNEYKNIFSFPVVELNDNEEYSV